jgi:xylulokinase
MWLMENDPEAVTKAESLLMPKDWINLKLTGECAQDYTEASLSFLMDQSTRDWSDELIALTGIPGNLLSPIRNPSEILGGLTAKAANHLGLSTGIPVLVGAGDYPTALLGSGVCGAGMGSDVTGTSTIMTLIHQNPVMHPNVSNLLEPSGSWGSFTLLDAGGDAMRWARRAFHENRRSYGEVADAAIRAQAGSNSLFFLPYLNGERFSNAPNSRAQFFGLTSGHGLAELHRSILEGVAFSVRLRLDLLQGSAGRPERFVASSGGAKSRLWLEIKASMYNTPYVVPEELECGVVGAAILMAHATGKFANLRSASRHMVQLGDQINPNPEWCDLYDRMMPIYSDLYHTSQQFYDRIDRL